MTVRITKIICPCCRGGEIARATPCMWCGGERRLGVKAALHYADLLHDISLHSASVLEITPEQRLELLIEATAIYRLAGEMPDWDARKRKDR